MNCHPDRVSHGLAAHPMVMKNAFCSATAVDGSIALPFVNQSISTCLRQIEGGMPRAAHTCKKIRGAPFKPSFGLSGVVPCGKLREKWHGKNLHGCEARRAGRQTSAQPGRAGKSGA